MTLSKAIPIRNASPAPLDGRLADMAQHVCNVDGTPRVGVLGNANLSIVSTLGTMNVAVAAAEFLASKGKADGVSVFTNDGVVNVPIAAAPGSNSRITVIWVKQEDDTTGDTASLPIFGTTNGTTAASPTKPAIPTGCLELATLRVYAGTVASNGGANTLVNTYQMTASRGGIVGVRTLVERDAWTAPLPCDGQMVYVADVDATYQYVNATIGWLHLFGKPIISNLSYVGLYSAGSPVPRAVEQGGMIRLEGVIASSTANFLAGATYTFGSIPAALAPSSIRRFTCTGAVTAVWRVSIDTAGTITGESNIAYGPSSINLNIDGCEWPDKRLG